MKLIFTITGKIKPYVRTTQRGKHVDKQWKEYTQARNTFRTQLYKQLCVFGIEDQKPLFTDKTPLAVSIRYYVPQRLHGFDLDNVVKSVLDSMQDVLYKNDAWVDRIQAERINLTGDDIYFCHISIEQIETSKALGVLKEYKTTSYEHGPK